MAGKPPRRRTPHQDDEQGGMSVMPTGARLPSACRIARCRAAIRAFGGGICLFRGLRAVRA
ncbi:hypothetical protein WI41_24050 [Burkholderia latens]|uniref:Uncharacterized protein n=1 Tax=Burkholderia latens TaxID=488446 RepID=A0AAP1G6B2_9BURK|nr:hypothetical protein WI41_24050 [Burkholderia latens]